MKRIDLNGQWFVKVNSGKRDAPAQLKRVVDWFPAIVPGTIHTDLLRENIIPDPYYRINENDVQWIENYQWLYRREFEIDASMLKEDSLTLVAEGLDTYATISLNGKLVGTTEIMFVEHRLNIKRYVKPGLNNIEILFDSPVSRSKQLEKKHGSLQVALEPHRVYVRKAQYSFGWDWGPKLTTSGIWRSISIEASSGPILKDPFVKTIELNKKSATIEVSVHIEKFQNPIPVLIKIEGEGFSQAIKKKASSSHLKFKLKIDRPHIWWPNGLGTQPLYKATFIIWQVEENKTEVTTTFGIRTIKLLQEKDEEGKSFIIEVNGVKVFCKGADWIPSDNFIPRIPDSTYERLLTMARDANMNMLRVWGGGIYEQEIFYNLCDKLGLLVWQDFMFACGEYPQTKWFLNLVKEEATKAVTRLRNHPSIVMWCGNNECEWLFWTENPDKTPDDMTGSVIFRDILPGAVKELDGSRPYWRSSPFGTRFPNDEANGTHHQWNVWSFWKDYKEYEKVNARFVSEFGFQAPANLRTWEGVTLPEDRRSQHPVIEHHNKQVEGQERLFRFQAAHYTVATMFDDFVYRGQLVQANALKTAVEHWRRRKFRTAGALFWQLNDCWPVSSWAVIDSGLRPKAAYYYAKRFFAPVLVSIAVDDDNISVWGTNDIINAINGKLKFKIASFDGKVVFEETKNITLKSNNSGKIYSLSRASILPFNKQNHFASVQLFENEKVISENRYFFAEPKHLSLPIPRLSRKIDVVNDSAFRLTIQTDVFAKDICMGIDGCDIEFEDNYFDLEPGSSKIIHCKTGRSMRDVEGNIKLISVLNNELQ